MIHYTEAEAKKEFKDTYVRGWRACAELVATGLKMGMEIEAVLIGLEAAVSKYENEVEQ